MRSPRSAALRTTVVNIGGFLKADARRASGVIGSGAGVERIDPEAFGETDSGLALG